MFDLRGYIQAIDWSGKHVRFTDTHRTYSPNPIIYNAGDAYATDFEIVVLHQLRLNALNDDPVDPTVMTQVYDIIQWMFDESSDGQLTTDLTTSESAIGIAFNDPGIRISLGTLTSDTASRILPEWVEIQIGEDLFKFWMLDVALETQYNIRQFKFADPIVNKESFYTSSKSGLESLLSAYNDNPYQALSAVLSTSPTSKVVKHVETWNAQSDSTNTLDIHFTIAVYGPRDPTAEELRQGVRAYLLSGSAYQSGQWETVFPGVFSVSSFDLIPTYNDKVDGTIPQYYNPIVNLMHYDGVLADPKFGYSVGWVGQHRTTLPTVYQSILCMVIPNESNDPAKLSFREFFPDYILAVDTGRQFTDYYRMNETTRRLVDMLNSVLPLAEGLTGTFPTGVTEENANGLRWYRFTVGESQIRILSKASFESIVV